jgi:hypothetical protein
MDPDLGPRFGTPIWDPDLGPHVLDPDLGPRFGTPIWGVIWDLHLGPCMIIIAYGLILRPSSNNWAAIVG